MTTPALAKPRDDDGPRIYPWPPQEPHEFEVISVTSAIKGGYPKPFLIGWAAKVAAEFAADNIEPISALVKAGEKRAAVDMIKNARYRDMGNKADRGTIVHAAVEAYIGGKPLTKADVEAALEAARVDPALAKATYPMAQGVLAYLQDTEPEIVYSERTVFSRTYGYAGTLDILARTHVGSSRQLAVVDVKTSKRIYDEVAMQLVAYARGDFIGNQDGTEIPLTEVPQWGVVVRPLANGRYETATFALTDAVFELFLACLRVATLDGVQICARRPS